MVMIPELCERKGISGCCESINYWLTHFLEGAKPGYLLRPDFRFGGLEDDGHVVESGIVHELLEEPLADASVAECLMTVHTAATGLLAVI